MSNSSVELKPEVAPVTPAYKSSECPNPCHFLVTTLILSFLYMPS